MCDVTLFRRSVDPPADRRLLKQGVRSGVPRTRIFGAVIERLDCTSGEERGSERGDEGKRRDQRDVVLGEHVGTSRKGDDQVGRADDSKSELRHHSVAQ